MSRWLMALLLVMLSSLATRAAEAYACYTSSNTTLTFYYDDQRSTRTGTTYLLIGNAPWYDIRTSVTKVVFDPTFADARPTSGFYWFYEMTNLTTIEGLNYLNTENMTNMNGMFAYCSSLTSIDVGHFNTANSVNMGGMFYGCSGVSSLDVSNFNTSKVTNMYGMFQDCSGLTMLDVSHFNTSKVITMGSMFQNCSGLTMLDLGSFNINKVENLSNIFRGCSSLATIYVGGGWFLGDGTYNVDTSNMFYGCTSLVGGQGTHYNSNPSSMDYIYAVADNPSAGMPGYMTGKCYVIIDPDNTTLTFYYDYLANTRQGTVYYPVWFTYNPDWYVDVNAKYATQVVFDPSFAEVRPTSTFGWFYGMNHLSSLSGMEYLNTEDVTNMKNMFRDCSALTSLDLSTFYTPNLQIMDNMFYGCNHLTTIYASDLWTTQSVTYGNDVFVDCFSLVGDKGTTYNYNNAHYGYAHLDGGPSDPGYFSEVPQPQAYACYTPENTTLIFYYDTQRSTREGTTYDLNEGSDDPIWYTDGTNPSVTQVAFDASFADARPTSTKEWFRDMSEIQSISGLEYLNTEDVTDMSSMFYGCSSITSLDLSHFNTAKVKNMGGLFRDCSGLKSVNLSSFITASVSYMNQMFYGCSNLTSLDLSCFNTRVVVLATGMFMNCNNLVTIYASDEWSTQYTMAHSGMFTGCTSLVGGMGTTYDANHVDKTYAHIDGGPSDPGYFTEYSAVEAYACYTPSNTTLTFYCDNQRSSRPGTTYDLNDDLPGWRTDGTYYYVTKVIFDSSFANARPTSTFGWFGNMENLQSITGIGNLNTSNVTYMVYMFNGCSRLTSLDLSSFNTANVTDMGYMFWNCSGLTSLDLSNFNTANVAYMEGMFAGCSGLTSLDLSNFNTANVTHMENMFTRCSGLTSLNLSNFNTAKVTNMLGMFTGCLGLTSLDLSNFNTANVTDMGFMFASCESLTTIYAGSGWNLPADGNTEGMFKDCTSLVGSMGTSYDPNHVDGEYAHIDGGPSNPGYFSVHKEAYVCFTADNRTMTFYYDDQLNNRPGTIYHLNTAGDLPEWYVQLLDNKCTKAVFDPSFADARPTSTKAWFYRIAVGSITGMEYLNTSEVTDMSYMFTGISLESLDVSHFNTAKVTNMSNMFHGSEFLTSLDLGSFNTSNVTDMNSMFTYCQSLTNLDLSNFNTANVTNMNDMFSNCSGLTSLDLSNFNTANVTDMGYMFNDCRSLTSLDLSNFNTANVTIMNGMFRNCSGLTNLDLSNFNTANVTNMNDMFNHCYGLTSVDLSSFNTANVTDMGYMFYDSRSLTSLDLSNFNTSSVTKMSGMFLECNSLETIYVGDGWSTDAVTQSADMFTDCMSLIGGMGTTYDANHVDKTYAHIDGGPSNPGYFTDPAVPSEPEAYACFTPSDSTLTFYFDSRRRFRSGTTYDLNTGLVQPDWLQLGTSVSHVVFDASFAEARPTTTFSWFESMSNLVSIAGMNYLNTEDVTIMASMFTECSALTSLDVSHFNTDKVTDMNGMFISCIGLTSLDVSNFNTENVTDMNNMFGNCRGLTSLDLSNFTTETVNNMRYMFYYCNNLTTIYVGNGWSTAAVTNSDKMFYRCTKLVGGNGTTYDSSHINADYAHIDGGPSNPGYLTAKLAFEPGDVNGDGKTTIADVTALISSLLSGEPTAGSGDINGDGRVTIADVSLLINQLLGSGN